VHLFLRNVVWCALVSLISLGAAQNSPLELQSPDSSTSTHAALDQNQPPAAPIGPAAATQSQPTKSPNHPTPDSSVFGAEFEQQVALLATDPTNRVPWNRLTVLALEHNRYFWEFRLHEFARRIEKDGKSAVAVDRSLTDEGVPKELVKAWVQFALTQIIVLDPEVRAKNNVDAIDLPFRDSYFPLKEMVREWQGSKQTNGSLRDPQLDTLTAMYEVKLLPVFVYLNYFDASHKETYAAWGKQHQADIAEYFKRFVFIPKNAVPEYAKADIDREYNEAQPETEFIEPSEELSAEEKNKLETEVMSLTKKLDAKDKAQDKVRSETGGAPDQEKAEIMLELGADLLRLKQYDLATQTLLTARSNFIDLNNVYGIAEASLQLGLTRESMQKYDEAIHFLGQAVRGFELIPDASKRHATALEGLAESEASAEHYADAATHARGIFTLVDAHTNDAEIWDSAMLATFNVYHLMFVSVDWNPVSGRERSVSDEDFVNNVNVGKPGEKYGQRSPDEDFATFNEFYNAQCQLQVSAEEQDCPLTRHVREQMKAGNFAPATKYVYFKFVLPYYQRDKYPSSDLSFNGVLIPDGSRRFALALCDSWEGDDHALVELERSAGIVKESDLAGVKRGIDGHQIKNDLTFAEIDAALEKALKRGENVPDRVKQVLTQFEEAYNFAVERKMKPFCERLRGDTK
jgi:hypothetical protein